MKINVTGCSLVDNLYSPVDFTSPGYRKWTAESGVVDGLITGGLIFGDELEESSGTAYSSLLSEIIGTDILPAKNIGGPGIVAAIHMSQILDTRKHSLGFFGSMGNDQNGRFLADKLKAFSIDIEGYKTSFGKTPFTDVLLDPSFHDNNGERTFINYIGAAATIKGSELSSIFFDADMLIFGGTALTPGIHDDLSMLLKKAKEREITTCVNTVYDFRNQKTGPEARWPLVQSDEDFKLIDLLIMDNEEALRISGEADKHAAIDFFRKSGVQSVIITHGAKDILCFSNGKFCCESGVFSLPVSSEAGAAMKTADAEEADTTGCGDNFAGGVYASLAGQLSTAKPHSPALPSLKKAAALGAVSGGFAGLYRGGVYYEKYDGEKLERLQPLLKAYEAQTGERYE